MGEVMVVAGEGIAGGIMEEGGIMNAGMVEVVEDMVGTNVEEGTRGEEGHPVHTTGRVVGLAVTTGPDLGRAVTG